MTLVQRSRMFGVLAAALMVASVSVAQAFNLRSPQVVFSSSSLQSYLNSKSQTINVTTDQLDAQVWSDNVSGNAEFTLMIELAGNAASNAYGIYNTTLASPPLLQVFPGAATAGWFATVHFSGTTVVVTLFDNNSIIQGQTTYGGVDPTHFGFYLQGPGGTFYSQDARNAGGNAQMLTFAGTGLEFGDWWECFEDLPFGNTGLTDFEDAVMLLQSVTPVPVRGTTFSRLKALYR